mmetsp:Transcript_39666/g.53946  ORF Transcript_39666/g.53946 Transcript_39666/m.53946 type:complete len:224 (+) Transcript_39666:184-855(+)
MAVLVCCFRFLVTAAHNENIRALMRPHKPINSALRTGFSHAADGFTEPSTLYLMGVLMALGNSVVSDMRMPSPAVTGIGLGLSSATTVCQCDFWCFPAGHWRDSTVISPAGSSSRRGHMARPENPDAIAPASSLASASGAFSARSWSKNLASLAATRSADTSNANELTRRPGTHGSLPVRSTFSSNCGSLRSCSCSSRQLKRIGWPPNLDQSYSGGLRMVCSA